MLKLLLPLLFITTASAAAAQDCTPIKFETGASGAYIDGILPPKLPDDASYKPVCYSVDVRKGQPMFVDVIGGGENVVVSVIGVGDARRFIEFAAPTSRVEFIVFHLFPTPREENYSLLVRAD